jgi:hypothetical protein
VVITQCPKKEVTELSNFLIALYYEYSKGHYPESGGYLDQSIKFIDAMVEIDRALNLIKGESKNG